MTPRLAASLLLCALLASFRPAFAVADSSAITVFGAASLTNVLGDLGDEFTEQTSIPVRFSFAASSALAHQIENGAPADIFFSADVEWMDYLQQRELIQRQTRHDVIGNRLVLIAPASSGLKLKIAPHFALAFVDRREAPLGIVYETDALIDKNVRTVDVFPADSHNVAQERV